MKFTFGIITNGQHPNNIRLIHNSIMRQNIDDEFEIVVVGGTDLGLPYTRTIEFDENIKPAWITRKKNLIAQEATYDNICLMHDYVFLYDGWYKNFKDFGTDWDVCMNSIINRDGQRFRDWITWPEWSAEGDIVFLDYEDHSRTDEMYISGTFFCVKKKFFLENPLNERLGWGQGEDVEWSGRLRKGWNYKCNEFSRVGFTKQKQNDHWYSETNREAREAWAVRKEKV